MNIAQTPQEVINTLHEAYYEHRDLKNILRCFTDNLLWVGAKSTQDTQNKQQLEKAIKEQFEKTSEGYHYRCTELSCQYFSDTLCLVVVRIDMLAKHLSEHIFTICTSYSCVRTGLGFKICAMHSSQLSGDGENNYLLARDAISTSPKQNIGFSACKNNLPGAVFHCKMDDELTITYAVDQVYEFLGYTEKEYTALFKNKLINSVHPDDRTGLLQRLQTPAAKAAFSHELRFICKDHSIRWVCIKGNRYPFNKLENDVPVNSDSQYFCVFLDITYALNVHELLVAEKNKLINKNSSIMSIYHNMPCGVLWYTLHPQPIVKYANSFVLNYLGVSESSDAMTENQVYLFNFIHPDDLEKAKNLHSKLKKMGDRIEFTIRTIDKNKETHWIKGVASVNYDLYKNILINMIYVDITEQKKYQEESDISRQTVELATQQTGVSFWIYDIENDCILQQENSKNVFGTAATIKNVPDCFIDNQLIHPDDIAALMNAHEQLFLPDVEPVSFNVRIRNNSKDDYWWAKIIYTRYYDDKEKLVKAIGTAVDITENIKMQEIYNDFETYQKIIASDSVGGFKLNLTRNTYENFSTDASNTLYLMNSLNATDFFDNAALYVVNAEKRERFKEIYNLKNLLKSFSDGKTHFDFECQFKTATGKIEWLYMPITLAKNPITNDIIGFTYGKLITEQKLSDAIIQKVVNNGYETIFRLDANEKTYELFSKSAHNTYENVKKKYTEEQIFEYIKNTCPATEYETTKKAFSVSNILAQLKNSDMYDFNYTIVGNGQKFLNHVQVFYVDRETKQICITRTDITNLISKEQQQRETVEQALVSAQQANKAKTKFLSAMSHDIRTPINAIIGMVELARQDIDNQDQLNEALNIIKSSSQHLLELVNNILDLSKIESGALNSINNSKLDITAEIRKLQAVMQPMCANKNQELCVTINPLEHNLVVGDALRLNRVLLNLLNNASKFTAECGKVELTVSQLPSKNDNIMLTRFVVSDNGIGIPKDKLPHIFAPFYREAKVESSQIEGTGLGLSIVKNIVDAKGGTISVKSIVSEGTTFTIDLPLKVYGKAKKSFTKKPLDELPRNAGHSLLGGVKILLCEDHPVNALVVTRLFESKGASVTAVANGEIGYNMFANSKAGDYDIIFMDIQMPVMNGYDATRKIRACRHVQAQSIPIFAMTANAFSDDIKHSLDCGMTGHIAKPIDFDSILKKLKPYLEKSSTQKD